MRCAVPTLWVQWWNAHAPLLRPREDLLCVRVAIVGDVELPSEQGDLAADEEELPLQPFKLGLFQKGAAIFDVEEFHLVASGKVHQLIRPHHVLHWIAPLTHKGEALWRRHSAPRSPRLYGGEDQTQSSSEAVSA